jgi:haloalkane dehalogenase
MIGSRASNLPQEVRTEYPFPGNTLLLKDDVRMHYLDEGSGPVVLLLHGNPTWSFYFRNVIKALSESGFRCIVPDHVGCGLSDKPENYPYTLKQRIDDVEALVLSLGLQSYSLIVHDWGGAIGCGLAARRPDAVDKLVLLNTAAFCSMRIPLRIAAIKIPVVGEFVIRALNGFAGPAANMSVVKPLSKTVRQGMLWPYKTWADRVAVWNFVKDIPLRKSHPSYTTLKEVETGLKQLQEKPIQIIWGMKDFCFNAHFLKRWEEIFPNAEVHRYPKFGHYVLEDGGVAVYRKIVNFLI